MLKHRLITGILVALFFLSALLFMPWWLLLGLMVGVFVLCLTEYREMICNCGYEIELCATFLCGTAYLLVASFESPLLSSIHPSLHMPQSPAVSEIILWLTPAVFLIVGILRRNAKNAFTWFAISTAAFWYTAMLISFMMLIAFSWPVTPGGAHNYTGRLVLVYFLLLVKMSDVGAYAFGVSFGKKTPRLIPEISPAKSVAGLGGAYVGSLASSLIVWACAAKFGNGHIVDMPLPLIHAISLAILMATVGVLGDLAESLFKRSLGVKDSSSRFPGLGGFLDMLDSLLFSAPFFYIYMKWFLS